MNSSFCLYLHKRTTQDLTHFAKNGIITMNDGKGGKLPLLSRIKKCQPGTTAYMETENGRQNYVCTKIFKGHNTGGLTDEEYNPIDDWNPGGITSYTCNGNWRNIVIVFFQPSD